MVSSDLALGLKKPIVRCASIFLNHVGDYVTNVFKISRLESIAECYRVLLSARECNRVLQSITEYYRVLQSTTEYYRVLQSIKEYNRV